ncbi:NAD(P)H-hydrate epimerase [Citricoccus alkalitolerans]|uniref:NAD(P)H-hydrate epimerase n=1 Tax=Citricoccus alkalitolerans TaxID=246603 RepID=A0ABV8XV08_9MICC
MIHAYTGAAVRAAESPLLRAGQGAALMRRAAWGLARVVVGELRRGPVAGATVTALVGTGNNGGDALWALAFLRRRGVNVVAVPTGERMHAAGGVIAADVTVTFGGIKQGWWSEPVLMPPDGWNWWTSASNCTSRNLKFPRANVTLHSRSSPGLPGTITSTAAGCSVSAPDLSSTRGRLSWCARPRWPPGRAWCSMRAEAGR